MPDTEVGIRHWRLTHGSVAALIQVERVTPRTYWQLVALLPPAVPVPGASALEHQKISLGFYHS